MARKTLLACLLLMVAIAGGCKPTTNIQVSPAEGAADTVSGPTGTPAPPGSDSLTGTPTVALGVWQTPTAIPTAAPVTVELSIGALWLKITAPPDNSIVSTPLVDVVGQATAGAVLTIGETIILVEEGQAFSAQIELANGPNIIEVLASDINGDELYYFLTVYYEPENQTGEGQQ